MDIYDIRIQHDGRDLNIKHSLATLKKGNLIFTLPKDKIRYLEKGNTFMCCNWHP